MQLSKSYASSADKRLLTTGDIAGILKISLNTVHNKEWQKRTDANDEDWEKNLRTGVRIWEMG